ncbi:MAG: hypothetical protein U5R14_00875 [Gemmatimonadota bacterium]|nr:hypothetical protein [Gemmatimonadota bacterium]
MHRNLQSVSTFFVLALLAVLPACSDDSVGPEVPEVSTREIGAVVTSTDVALTLFDVEDPASTETVGLGADGSPVSLAVRGEYAAVPLGVVPAVAVVDLEAAELERTVSLPEGSGATGAAFVNDSIVLVANPNLNTVTPVNVLAGTAADEIPVGRYPQGVVVAEGRAYVLNGELEEFSPDGPSTITVLDAETLAVLDTIELSGENAGAGAVGPDGRLYVIQSGSFGAANGALSVVDPGTGTEVDFFDGFGDFPGSLAVDSDGIAYVGAFGVGTLVWNSATGSFARGPDDAVAPGGVPSTSGIGIDSEGRVYTLEADCENPARVHRLDADYTSETTVPVGICPFAIAFTEVEEEL